MRLRALVVIMQLLLLTCAGRRELRDVPLEPPEPVEHEVEPLRAKEEPPTVRVKLWEWPGFRIELEDSFTVYQKGAAILRGSGGHLDLALITSKAARLEFYAFLAEEENRLKAVFHAESLKEDEGASVSSLIQQASLKFNLSPKDELFLMSFYNKNKE